MTDSAHFFIVVSTKRCYTICIEIYKVLTERSKDMFVILGGGLLIIIFAVVISVVSSVTSAVAADADETED